MQAHPRPWLHGLGALLALTGLTAGMMLTQVPTYALPGDINPQFELGVHGDRDGGYELGLAEFADGTRDQMAMSVRVSSDTATMIPEGEDYA